MNKKKSKKGIIILISVLLIAALAGAFYLNVSAANEKDPETIEREYPVEKGDITVGVDADGKLAAKNIGYDVSEGILIKNVLVEPGQMVKAGDRLAELSVDQAQKNYEKYKEAFDQLKEDLDGLKEDREDYLLSLNWLLENQKEDSYNNYIDKYWELKNEIWSLENNIYEAEDKKDWSDQGELMDGSIHELKKALEAKQAELEKLEADREQQEADEDNLGLQKERQEKKLREYDEKIEATNAQLEETRAKMEQAKSRFLCADRDGVILKANYKNGDEAKSGLPVIELGDLNEMYLKLLVEPENIADIEEGQQVEFYVDAYPDQVFTGEVSGKNLVQNTEGKYEVLVKVQETDSQLLDGMGAAATIIVKQKKDVLTLQNKAIFADGGKQYVKVRNSEGELENKEITAGFSDGRVTEILSGLNEGDVVICEE